MIKRLTTLAIALFMSMSLYAQVNETATEATEIDKKEIVKTGYNYGPLPAVAFDADKGFQLGALLNIYDFGDGSTYPNTRQQWYFEASFFTKGSQQFMVSYDNRFLIPGVRWSTALTIFNDKAMDFYGFNGYMAHYDHEMVVRIRATSRTTSTHPSIVSTVSPCSSRATSWVTSGTTSSSGRLATT